LGGLRTGAFGKITGGNADICENKGVAKIATQKMLKTKELQIDGLRDALRVREGRRDEAGTLSADSYSPGRGKSRELYVDANVAPERIRWGTRGQLVAGPVEGQMANF
jgi:hypothetical protein